MCKIAYQRHTADEKAKIQPNSFLRVLIITFCLSPRLSPLVAGDPPFAFPPPATNRGAPSFPFLEGWESQISALRSCFPFTFQGRPMRLNLHRPSTARCGVSKAGPRPVLRLGYQTSLHRIAMHVPELFDGLVVGEDV